MCSRAVKRSGIYILIISPPGRGGVSKLKNREEFEGGLKTLPEEFEETSNKSPKKQGRISTGWGNKFSGLSECIPLQL